MTSINSFGRYEIKGRLGEGGMASVYLAHDPRFGRDVALKVLPQKFLDDPMFRQRFEREARTVAMLEHAAIVPVYDFGEERGQPYLVMRLMRGGSLSDRMGDGTLTINESLAILRRVAAALDTAHAIGVVHRDLKPGNILFDRQGNAFLSDFGIVKVQEASSDLTGTSLVGTPSYMSPEQVQGSADIDGRSDIYALGIILFEMLSGRRPYTSDSAMGIAVKHVTEPVPDILAANPLLPSTANRVVQKALAKRREERYQTAKALIADLSEIASGSDVPSQPAPAGQRPAGSSTRINPPDSSLSVGEDDAGQPAGFDDYPATSIAPPPSLPGARAAAPAKKRSPFIWIGAAVIAVVCIGGALLAGGLGALGFFENENGTSTPGPVAEATPIDASDEDVATSAADSPPADTPASTDEPGGLERVQAATVQIEVRGSQFLEEFIGTGSGVIYDSSGLILTNNHVVEGAAIIQVALEGRSNTLSARVVGRSPCDDLAVLALPPGEYPTAQLADFAVSVGETVFTVGYPLGDPTQSVTRGVISKTGLVVATDFADYQSALQTDAAINPGNSGGPLITEAGYVVGINSAGRGDAQGTNFAIDIQYVLDLLPTLESGENLNWIGANVAPLTEAIANELGISMQPGLFVYGVDSGSPADNAGIEEGDFIVFLDGAAVGDPGTLEIQCRILRAATSGATLPVTFVRDGSRLNTELTLP